MIGSEIGSGGGGRTEDGELRVAQKAKRCDESVNERGSISIRRKEGGRLRGSDLGIANKNRKRRTFASCSEAT